MTSVITSEMFPGEMFPGEIEAHKENLCGLQRHRKEILIARVAPENIFLNTISSLLLQLKQQSNPE
jgi:hypothetical protein